MEQELLTVWERLQATTSAEQGITALLLGAYLLLAGLGGLYLRFLYRHTSGSASDADAITRVFPLLVVITTAVIAVVKSSLALSLGLVGALSIVRFRSAIKEPEELVYLFLCVAVGLALGNELPLLAILLILAATIFTGIVSLLGRRNPGHSVLLTVTGESPDDFGGDAAGVLALIGQLAGPYTLQRFDWERGCGQIRLLLRHKDAQRTAQLVTELQRRLPACSFSCVNVSSAL